MMTIEKIELFLNKVTHLHVTLIEESNNRAEIDGYITDYHGFIRAITRLLDHEQYDTKQIHLRLSIYLRNTLVARRCLGLTVGFSSALKFAYGKLDYKDVEDIM